MESVLTLRLSKQPQINFFAQARKQLRKDKTLVFVFPFCSGVLFLGFSTSQCKRALWTISPWRNIWTLNSHLKKVLRTYLFSFWCVNCLLKVSKFPTHLQKQWLVFVNRLTVVVQVSVVLNKTRFNNCDLTFQLPEQKSIKVKFICVLWFYNIIILN